MRKLSVLLVLIAFLGHAPVADAHEGQPDVMGTVASIDERRIEVMTPEGGLVSADLTINTKYTQGFAPMTRSDVKVGMRVVLHYEALGDQRTVSEVKLGTASMSHPVSAHPHGDQPMVMRAGPLGLPESRMASGTAWRRGTGSASREAGRKRSIARESL